MRTGDCFEKPSSSRFTLVRVVPCSAQHDAQTFAQFDLGPSLWPGSDSMSEPVRARCQQMAPDAVDFTRFSAATFDDIYPDRQAWQNGHHTVSCMIYFWMGKITGSVLRHR
jgi:hypothetical protein